MIYRSNRVRKIKAAGPYLFAVLGLAILLFLRFSDPFWITTFTQNYLTVHIILEFVGILVSFAIFTVGWSTYQNARGTDILVLSIASFAVGALDLGHTLSFTGMPDFVGPSGPNKAIDFWFASRITSSFAFLYLALSRPRVLRFPALQWLLVFVAVSWVAVSYWVILFHSHWLPTFYIPGDGLQPIKVLVEWILILVVGTAGVLMFVSAEKSENMNIKWMGCSALIYGMAGYFFTIYTDFDDVFNFSGHCFKAVSFLVLYRAVFVQCVSRPYERVQQLALEAEASNISKSRFLANVSHEFRTPLGVIAGFGDLILESGKLSEPQLGWTQTIVRNARQLRMLIDDLLDLAKAETEKVQIHYSKIDLANMIGQLTQTFELQRRTAAVKIRVDNQLGSSCQVVTDELRLRQILMNIVGNAIKFTSDGEIKISMRRLSDTNYEIAVTDTGIGIEAKDVERLFLPFSQVSNPTRRRFAGTGLGLSLSRKLAELLGGTLVLKNSQLGVGSCFAVTFADHSQDPDVKVEASFDAKIPTTIPRFEKRRVLVAEDSEDNQMLIQTYLQPTGVELLFADNGRIVLELTAKSAFDLILMDIQMPEMDGFEAAQELRRRGWTGPIVALTAHALKPERDRAMQNGFDDYLIKPVMREALWAAMNRSMPVL